MTFATIGFALKCGLALGSSSFLWIMVGFFEGLSAELEEASGAEVIPISGASGVGVDWVLDKLLEAIPTNESPVDDDGAEDEVQWSPL